MKEVRLHFSFGKSHSKIEIARNSALSSGAPKNAVRLSAYRDFYKALQRIRLLYEATMHSYGVLYKTGREELGNRKTENSKVEFRMGTKVIARPLRLVTFQARDVYPELLRSTLLVRLVAAYEAYLVDCVEEISQRSRNPFLTEGRVEFSQEQLLTIDTTEGVFQHLVKRTLRRLTGGGLKEIQKFFVRNLGVELTSDPASFKQIEEAHDRRHIFVHRSGYADAEYIAKHAPLDTIDGSLLKVSDTYLLNALRLLGDSALHVKKGLETIYPTPPTRSYLAGDITLPADPKHFLFISFVVVNGEGRAGFTDLSLDLGDGVSLKNIVVWSSDDGKLIRLVVGADDRSVSSLWQILRERRRQGHIEFAESFKIKR